MDSVARASTAQAGSPEARVPISSYLGLIGRYALIAVVVYVIFSRLPDSRFEHVGGVVCAGSCGNVCNRLGSLESR